MTNRTKRMLEELTSTMKINPDLYSLNVSPNRIKSLGFALAGWLYMLRYQKNTRIMSVSSLVIFILALWLQVDFISWAILILTITAVWMAEFLNAAVEAVVNLATSEFHPMAKVAKDVAAAAVLLGAVASVLVGLLILGPPLLHKLGY
ncbi:MAG: diacylglycerol kinase family protein [Anaerolineaceae bacterium]|nr:diacylglycerol kinase family protein [Anaerolineaceae bacterium]